MKKSFKNRNKVKIYQVNLILRNSVKYSLQLTTKLEKNFFVCKTAVAQTKEIRSCLLLSKCLISVYNNYMVKNIVCQRKQIFVFNYFYLNQIVIFFFVVVVVVRMKILCDISQSLAACFHCSHSSSNWLLV